MKKLKKPGPRKLSRKIISLSNLKLENYSVKGIATFLRNSFNVPYNTWDQYPSAKNIYRACINIDEQPFNSIDRIAYNPNPDYIGRANLIGKSVVYAGNALDLSAIEVCQNTLRNTIQRSFYLTIGEWAVQKLLNVIIICHSKKALNAGTDLDIAYNAIRDKKWRELKSRKEFRIWNLKNRFFAEQFSKSNIKHQMDYIFSALYGNTIFNSKPPNPIFDGIWYPSQSYLFKGFNFAYKSALIKDKVIIPIRVHFVQIDFYQNYMKYPKKIEILQTTENIKGDEIIWV